MNEEDSQRDRATPASKVEGLAHKGYDCGDGISRDYLKILKDSERCGERRQNRKKEVRCGKGHVLV